MTTQELKEKQASLENEFKEYQSILKEVYENMYQLSSEYNEINEILKQRNGQ